MIPEKGMTNKTNKNLIKSAAIFDRKTRKVFPSPFKILASVVPR